MAASIQNSILGGALDSIYPVGGIVAAGYLNQSPLIGASGGILAAYATNMLGSLGGPICAGLGALYLPSYLPLGEGLMGTVLGGIVGGSAYNIYSNYLMTPGKAGIVSPSS